MQTLQEMSRDYVLDFEVSWDDHMQFIEFTYNKSYHSNILMDSYKALLCQELQISNWFVRGW